MDELLKTLTESELLTSESKEQITEAVQAHIDEKINEGVEIKTKIYREKLKEQFIAEQDKLVNKLDKFLKCNMKGALAESIRDEFRTEFNIERKKLVEGLNVFLEQQLAGIESINESKSDLSAKAFYKLAKEFIVNESDVDDKVAKQINRLQAALKESKSETAKVYRKLAESKKSGEKRILEGKVKNTLRLIPEDKRKVARRLLAGVELSEFDRTAKAVVDELVESEISDKPKVKSSKHTEKVVLESTGEKKKEGFDEDEYILQLANS